MKNYILETLLEEKNNNLKGMLYHNLQIKFAYNSNHKYIDRRSDKTYF